MDKKPFWDRMVEAYYENERTSAEELDKVCLLMARICVHSDEDMPSEYRTRHFRDSLNEAVDYLEKSGWYDFQRNKLNKNKQESKNDNTKTD